MENMSEMLQSMSCISAVTKNMSEILQSIEEMTINVDAVQERVLADILARNGDAEYLAKCGLAAGAGAGDRATFRAKVPMVTYQDLKPYIMRVANGDTSPVLTGSGHRISELLVSSGTSGGEPKLIPTVKDEHDRRMLLHIFITAVMNKYVPGLDKGSGLYFRSVKSPTTTPGGLPAQTLTASFVKSDHYKKLPYDPSRGGCYTTSPAAAVLCEDTSQSMYAQMLCGLCCRHAVLRIGAGFAYGLVRAVSFLQRNWRHLAADIEAGALVSRRVTDPAVCEAVAAVLRPDPDLARFIRRECSGSEQQQGNSAADPWNGILVRLWPNAKFLDTIATGSMAQYVPALRYYSGGGLPIVSTIYASSECHLGLNLRPMSGGEATYTIMPNMAYFEFLPSCTDNAADDDATPSASELVELARVEAGREYELVVTTYGGLYRYRVGDVLRVAGFHNAAPEFRFVRRNNVLLSVDGDRTNEAHLQRAVERASAALLRPRGAAVLDYSARVCAETLPGHYVLYWELQLLSATNARAAEMDADVLDRCCSEMEEALGYWYREGRVRAGSIGPLEIRVVRPGTFEEVADYAVSRGAAVGQYKVPRCVTAPAIVELLDSRVVSNHFSPALPHWDSAGLRFEEETTTA